MDRGAGHDEAEGMDRIRRIGRQHHVARRGNRGGERGQPLFRAHGHHHFGLGIEFDIEAGAVVIGLRPAQAGDALGLGIAVGVGLRSHFDQLVDDVLRRRKIGVAHAEIDHILTLAPRRRAHRVDLGDDIGRQKAQAVEFIGHGSISVVVGMMRHGLPAVAAG